MKSREEIEQLAEKNFPIEEYPTNEGFEHFAYKQGYIQCQNDMDKKYTEEDMLKCYQDAVNNVGSYMSLMYKKDIKFISSEEYINSLNKQDNEK